MDLSKREDIHSAVKELQLGAKQDDIYRLVLAAELKRLQSIREF
jgi:hypothetical protein